MSFDITTAFINQFGSAVDSVLQQKGSRLRSMVRNETQKSEFRYFERIGKTEAMEVTGRHQDTPIGNVEHLRRRVAFKDYDWGVLIDSNDKLRMLIDPTSIYASQAGYAFGRSIDKAILNAAFGRVESGKSGEIITVFPSSQVIPVNYKETGSAVNVGLTIPKLRRAKVLLDRAENDPSDPRYIICSTQQLDDLLRTIEVTSADYNAVKALVHGEVNSFLGFEFHRTELVTRDANSYRRVLCYCKSGLLLSTAKDVSTMIGPRPDKRFNTQVYVKASFGAIRMMEESVLEIKCLDVA